jgi:hypothetical protein
MPERAPSKDVFLLNYEKYYEAKQQQQHRLIWLYAVLCRAEIQKLAIVPHNAPRNEGDVLQEIFSVLTKEQIKSMYTELCHDTKQPSSWN